MTSAQHAAAKLLQSAPLDVALRAFAIAVKDMQTDRMLSKMSDMEVIEAKAVGIGLESLHRALFPKNPSMELPARDRRAITRFLWKLGVSIR